ncbi:MAG: archease [Deltaproteobacteria bacterium]|nr:archease [Deltaproteobacteria bacterium]
MGRWEHFQHQADIGIRGIGATAEEAFEEAGKALIAVMCDVEKIEPKREVEAECDGDDLEMLFADWINSIIFYISAERMLFSEFEVEIDEGGRHLKGIMRGREIDLNRDEIAVEVKAATYAMLKAAKQGDVWVAQCVVDV